jgi:HK97 family phage prohead protease
MPDTNPAQLIVTASQVSVDVPSRRITGLIAPWDVVGYTSAGATRFARGSIAMPTDPRRVKLLIQHGHDLAAVGLGHSFETTPAGVIASFDIPAGPAGDDALALAANGLRDGLSVGVLIDAHTRDGDVINVSSARVYEVSLVTIPAFDDARVLDVAAQRERPTTMPDNEPTEPAASATPAAAPIVTAGVSPSTPPVETRVAPAVAAQLEPQARAINPTPPQRPMTLQAAASRAAQYLREGGEPGNLQAALLDLLPSDDAGLGFFRPAWLGELWKASLVQRPLIDSITNRVLTSTLVQGFQWDTKWSIDPYTGNKTPVPSNKASTKPLQTTPVRWGGALDIDRIYIDLGDGSIVQDLFAQGADAYKRQTEAWAQTQLLADATPIDSTSASDFMIKASTDLMSIGAQMSFMLLAPDLYGELAALTDADVPFWFRNGVSIGSLTSPGASVNGFRVAVGLNLPAGTALAGDSRAATYFEAGAVPIEVTAVSLANGGYDIGAFGYSALLVNDPSAILKSAVAAAPAVASPAPSTSKVAA